MIKNILAIGFSAFFVFTGCNRASSQALDANHTVSDCACPVNTAVDSSKNVTTPDAGVKTPPAPPAK